MNTKDWILKLMNYFEDAKQGPWFGTSILDYFMGKAIGEGNGTPLQYSCLENPMDGGAW